MNTIITRSKPQFVEEINIEGPGIDNGYLPPITFYYIKTENLICY